MVSDLFGASALAVAPSWALAVATCLLSLAAAWVDVRERRIPNVLVACMAACALVEIALTSIVAPFISPGSLASWSERVGWALGVLLLVGLIEVAWRRHCERHGIGFGDIKLLSALALWLGPTICIVFAASCAFALAVELPRGRTSFAFGPYIATVGCVCLAVTIGC